MRGLLVLEHDPGKVETGFPSRQTRNAFARRSCSNKELEHDGDSTSSHHALGVPWSCKHLRAFSASQRVTAFDLELPVLAMAAPALSQLIRDHAIDVIVNCLGVLQDGPG